MMPRIQPAGWFELRSQPRSASRNLASRDSTVHCRDSMGSGIPSRDSRVQSRDSTSQSWDSNILSMNSMDDSEATESRTTSSHSIPVR